MKALVLVFTVVCYLQLAPVTASPAFFGTVFKVFSNAASAITGSVAETALAVVNATTDAFSNAVDRIALFNSLTPVARQTTDKSSKVINKVENVIDKTAEIVTKITAKKADNISKKANTIIDNINSRIIGAKREFLISFIIKINNELTNICKNLTVGVPISHNIKVFLTKALDFLDKFQEKLYLPDFSPGILAEVLKISESKITVILAAGPLNLPLKVVNKVKKIIAKVSEVSPAIGLLILKYRLKLILAQGAVDAANKGLIAAGETIINDHELKI